MKTGPKNWLLDLSQHLRRHLDTKAVGFTTKTKVGVEQEFFLLNAKRQLATLEESQTFLRTLSEKQGWNIYPPENAENSFIERVSTEKTKAFTAVKYEYKPHLLEIAFAPEDSLRTLNDDLVAGFNILTETAIALGFEILHSPSVPSDIVRALQHDPRLAALSFSRKILFSKRGEPVDLELAEFPAFTAATQIHLGGPRWWNDDHLVEALYCLEPEIMGAAYALRYSKSEAATSAVMDRWRGYATVFRGSPLLGFPDLKTWNFDNWVDGLTKSSLIGGADCAWAGESLHSLGYSPFSSWTDFLNKVRDVQLIKPKMIGTLEFRGDPAQSSAKDVMALAALRLATLLGISNGRIRPAARTFGIARDLWWKTVNGKIPIQAPTNEIIDVFSEVLEQTEPGSSQFLSPLKWKSIG